MYGRISCSRICFQMIRVISSPSSSTTGLLTLIFAIDRRSSPGHMLLAVRAYCRSAEDRPRGENGTMSAIRKIGPLTVIALQDAEGPFFEPREAAIPGATPAQWAAADEQDPAARTADGRWWLRFRSFAIRYGDSGPVTLIDAGIGPAHSLAAEWAPVPGRLPD